MAKRIFSVIVVAAIVLGAAGFAAAAQKLFVYTSMKESLIGELKTAFAKKHPDIKLDYQSAGAGKLMAKIAAERESGKILADVLWTSEVPDFYQLKAQGLLENTSRRRSRALSTRCRTTTAPSPRCASARWASPTTRASSRSRPRPGRTSSKPAFKGAFGIANPALSGTAYMSVAMLEKAFGWEYFQKLRANGAKMGKGSGQVVDDTASGDLVASLAVDYITLDKIDKGATLALVYPPEMLVIPSPVDDLQGQPQPRGGEEVRRLPAVQGRPGDHRQRRHAAGARRRQGPRQVQPADAGGRREARDQGRLPADDGREGSDHQEVHRHHAGK